MAASFLTFCGPQNRHRQRLQVIAMITDWPSLKLQAVKVVAALH